MTKQQLQIAAQEKFPLPKKEDYIGGEAYAWEASIIRQRQRDWLDGAQYANRPLPWIMIGFIMGILIAASAMWVILR